MISQQTFLSALAELSALMPRQRQFTPESLVSAWDFLPSAAKSALTDEALGFAVRQRMLDHRESTKDIPLHLSICQYIFPLSDGVPNFAAGLRNDLHQRMADPDRFHDPTRSLQIVRPKTLAGGDQSWHPSQLSPEERRAGLERALADLERMKERGAPTTPLRASEAAMGERLFAAVVAGFTPLDARTLGASWAVRNFDVAKGHLEAALAMESPRLPAPAKAVAGILGWHPEQDPGESDPETFEEGLGL